MAIAASTAVISAASVTTAGVSNLSKTTANASTSAYILSIKVTLGSGSYPNQKLQARYTSSPYDISTSANLAQLQLQGTARWHDMDISKWAAGETRIEDTTLEVITGGFIYVWLEGATYSPALTVTVTLVELA